MRKLLLAILLLLYPIAALAQQGNQVIPTASAGVTQVATLPATCTNTSSAPIQITATVTQPGTGVNYGPGTIFYCDSTNHYSPVSQGSGASPILGFYLSNQCPPSNSTQCFYTPANTQQAVDCSWTSGSKSVACATSHFVATDVGKRIMGWSNCEAEQAFTTNAGATALVNGGVGLRQMSIATYVSGTSITVSINADNTASGNTHCLVWGTPDDVTALALDTAVQAVPTSGQCPIVHLASGYYWFNNSHFYTQPVACTNLGTIYNGSAANTVYAAGYDIDGRGTGNTVIFLANDFPETGGSGGLCNNGASNVACFVRTLNGRWKDFQITGGQNVLGTANPNNLIEVQGPGSIDNFTCTNFGMAQTNFTGMTVNYWDRWYQVNNSGCGYTGLSTSAPITNLVMYKYRSENSAVGLLHQVNGYVQCIDCGFLGSDAGLVSSGMIQNTAAGSVFLYDSQVAPLAGPSGVIGYLASTTAGSILYLRDTNFVTGTATNFSAVKCLVQCYVIASTSNFNANGTGHPYVDGNAGSFLYDQGGNGGFTSGGGSTVSGTVTGSSSITGSNLVTGNVVISSCGTSAASLFSGASQKGQFTVTFAGTPGTTCTATVTFPVAFLTTPICTWSDVGGTNAVATTVANGTQSNTATAVTFSGPTFTNGNTEIMQYSCSNP